MRFTSLLLALATSTIAAPSKQNELYDETGRRVLIEQTSLEIVVELTILSPLSPKRRIHLIPALFGAQHIPLTTLPLLINTHIDTCNRYTQPLPFLSTDELTLLEFFNENKTADYTLASSWLTAVPRGDCPFDQKILNSQIAGFASAIIYNPLPSSDQQDSFIRMSSNHLGNRIIIPSLFTTYSEFSSLLVQPQTLIVQIRTVPWSFFIHGSLSSTPTSITSLILFYTSLIMLCISLSMTLSILIGMLRNLYNFGTLSIGQKRLPKLKTYQLNFPIITYTHALLSVTEPDCCAICIDDFTLGSCARELPCSHRFHTDWYSLSHFFLTPSVDPWLLKHNRLCPICKLDVTEKMCETAYAKQRSASVNASMLLSSDPCDDLTESNERQGMLLYGTHS